MKVVVFLRQGIFSDSLVIILDEECFFEGIAGFWRKREWNMLKLGCLGRGSPPLRLYLNLVIPSEVHYYIVNYWGQTTQGIIWRAFLANRCNKIKQIDARLIKTTLPWQTDQPELPFGVKVCLVLLFKLHWQRLNWGFILLVPFQI